MAEKVDAVTFAALKAAAAAIQSNGALVEQVVKEKDGAHDIANAASALVAVRKEHELLAELQTKTSTRIRKVANMIEALNAVRDRGHEKMAEELLEEVLSTGAFTLQELVDLITMPDNRMDAGVLHLVERGVRLFAEIAAKTKGTPEANPDILYQKFVELVALRNAALDSDAVAPEDEANAVLFSETAVYELKQHIIRLKGWEGDAELVGLRDIAHQVLSPNTRKQFADAAFVLRVCLAHVANADHVLAQRMFELVTSPSPAHHAVELAVVEEEEEPADDAGLEELERSVTAAPPAPAPRGADEDEVEDEVEDEAHASATSGHVSETNECENAGASSGQLAGSTGP